MERLKVALLIAVALLITVFLIDRHREAEPMRQLRDQVAAVAEGTGRTEAELIRARQAQQELAAKVEQSSTAVSGLVKTTAEDAAATQAGIGLLTQGLARTQAGIDQSRQDQAALAARLDALQTEMAAKQREFEARIAALRAPTPVAATLDGVPRLGVPFLKPYDRSGFDPKRLRGVQRGFSDTPNNFNPILGTSANAQDVETLANDTLADRHPATPDLWSQSLATDCRISDDWTVYTFTIRRGVLWHRPAIAKRPEFAWLDRDVELTAHDFVFYLDLVMDPTVEAPSLRAYYEDLAKAEALDDHTLRLTWKRKVYTSLAFSMGLSPLPRHVYGRDRQGRELPVATRGAEFNKHWFDAELQFVGVGAYRVAEIAPDRRLRFERNPAYWGVSRHFEAIEWDAEVRKPDAQLVAFKNGQVLSHGLTPNQFKAEVLDRKEPRFPAADPANPKAGRAGPFAWEKVVSSSYQYIGWNMRRPILADRRVRHALAHAFPKKRIIDEVYMGLGRPQIGPVHPDHPSFNRELRDFAFDPAKAKALLAEAGWTDSDGDGVVDKVIDGARKSLSIELLLGANSPEGESLSLIYRNNLKTIGVELVPLPVEWKDMLQRTEDVNFDAVMMGWRMGLDLDFKQLWDSKAADEPRSSNHCGFKNARVDELAEALRVTFEADRRDAIAKEIQALIFAEQPYLFVRCTEGIFVWNRERLGGVELGLDAYHPMFSRDPRAWYLLQP